MDEYLVEHRRPDGTAGELQRSTRLATALDAGVLWARALRRQGQGGEVATVHLPTGGVRQIIVVGVRPSTPRRTP